jgi:hypothetical protein
MPLLSDGADQLGLAHLGATLDAQLGGLAPQLGTVIAPAPLPVPFEAPRLRAAALAPSRPRSLLVCFDSLVIVFFLRAPA